MNSNYKIFGILRDIIMELEKNPQNMGELIIKITSNSSLKQSDIETSAILGKRLGFIEIHPDESMKTTVEGTSFAKHITAMEADEEQVNPPVSIFDESSIGITMPHFFLPIPLEIKNKILFTRETIGNVISDAQKITYIVTPFLDIPILQSFFENVRRKPEGVINIVTSEENLQKWKNSTQGNFILDELGKLLKSRYKQGAIYFVKKDMSISHAKIFCSENSLFVTSANVKKDSLSENFELGILTERKDLISTVIEILEFIIDSRYAQCIHEFKSEM